jgi:hypothetical protein
VRKILDDEDGIKWYTVETLFNAEVGHWIRQQPTDQWRNYYVYNYYPYDIREDLYIMFLLRWSQ